MAHPFFNRPFLRQDALLYALLATLAYDAAVNSEILGAVVEWGLFFLAIPARVFLYTCLFLSLPPLVSRLSGRNDRLFRLTALWLAASLALLATMWGVLALGGIAQDVAVKRFTPDTLADFAPGWTMAEVALGKKTAEAYTWVTAITAEALAILGMTLLVAGYLKLLSAFRLAKSAGFAPLLAAFSMGLYAFNELIDAVNGYSFWVGAQ